MDELPRELPVLTLPNTVFFPHSVLPLHIFEPRYRLMLRDVLKDHRIFAVATLDHRRTSTEGGDEPPCPYATAGIIRACQKADDGTSDLLLEGIWRIAIERIVREEPYRVVAATPVPDNTDACETTLRRLLKELVRAVETRSRAGIPVAPHIERTLHDLDDPAALCDILLFSSVGDLRFKMRMLGIADTAVRLQRTIERLREETRRAHIQQHLQGSLGDDEIPHN